MNLAKWAACIAVAGLLIAGCKRKDESAETPAPQPKAAEPVKPASETAASGTPAAGATGAQPAATPHGDDPSLLRPARLKEQSPDKYEVRFDTTRGAFTVKVTRAWAPLGADRFYNLVKHHFYDGAAFFRVVPGFVVQFGISAYPRVSAAWQKTEIKDDPVVQSNKKGYLTFAKTGAPDSRTTQIFINLKDNQRLDGMGFAPFGVVDGNGMNVVDMLYDVYGDAGAPDQEQLEKQGDPYLKKGWPKLDYIKTATLVQ